MAAREPDQPAVERPSRLASTGRWIAFGLAVTVVGTLFLAAAATYLPAFHICREHVADTAVVELCGPISAADVMPVGLALLIAAFLLVPFVSEIGVPGLFSMKIRLQQQEQKTAQLEERITQLTVTQQSRVEQNTFLVSDRFDKAEVDRKLSELLSATITYDGQIALGTRQQEVEEYSRPMTPERAIREAQLRDVYEEIRRYLFAIGRAPGATSTPPERVGGLGPLQVGAISMWEETFRNEIEQVRAARNTVVHVPQNLTDEHVRDALELGQRVLSSVKALLARVTKAEQEQG